MQSYSSTQSEFGTLRTFNRDSQVAFQCGFTRQFWTAEAPKSCSVLSFLDIGVENLNFRLKTRSETRPKTGQSE